MRWSRLRGAFVNRPVVEELGTVKRAGIASLTEGQRVAFDVALGGRGPEAAGLRLI